MHFPANGELGDDSLTQFEAGDGYMTGTDKFKYLGSNLHFTLSDDYKIKRRIQQATAAMACMLKVFRNGNINIEDKRRFYQSIPINLLLWECEAWEIKELRWKN